MVALYSTSGSVRRGSSDIAAVSTHRSRRHVSFPIALILANYLGWSIYAFFTKKPKSLVLPPCKTVS